MVPVVPGVPAPPGVPATSVEIVGWLTGVEAKPNGRFSVKVKRSAEDQYGVSMNTKDTAIVQDLMQRIGQQLRFQCGISHWFNQAINQNVESKWINQYAPVGQDVPVGTPLPVPAPVAGTSPPVLPTAPAPQPSPRSRYPFKDEAIAFQSMAKGLAVECFKRLPTEQQTLAGAVRIARYWAAEALQIGAQGLIEQPPVPESTGIPRTEVAETVDGFDQPPPPGDDDIPF